jgi:segregation and condensation protein B
MPYKKLSKILGVSESEILDAVKKLDAELKNRDGGLWLVSDEEKIQLTTRPEFAKLLEQIIKEELKEDLSPASLETLSIIAYSAPISRAELDYVRGVNSSFILRSLLLRGLIERETDPKRGNAFIYRPSLEFLKFVGASSAQDLPEFEKYSKLLSTVRKDETQPS